MNPITKNNSSYYFCIFVAIVTIILIYLFKNPTQENYSITLGMGAPQNKFYGKCVNDCVRNKTGDSSPGQFLWLCTDKCQEMATARISQGVPDLTDSQYQRYNSQHLGDKSSTDLNMWLSPYVESNYCLNDIKSWCKERICPFAKNKGCMDSCMRVNAVKCGGSIVGGWMP